MNVKSAYILGAFILASALILSAAILLRPESGRYVLTLDAEDEPIVTDSVSGSIWFFNSKRGEWRESAEQPWID